MRLKTMAMVVVGLFLCFLCQITARAQGGWDVWTVYLHDGTRIEAAPVWSLDEKVLKYGMSGEVGEGKSLKRSLIKYMSRNVGARQSSGDVGPTLPESDVKQDLIIMHDGRQVSGTVLIRAQKDSQGKLKHFSPVLVQNGVETELTEVDQIKLAKPQRSQKRYRN